jgi:hypothetical protein
MAESPGNSASAEFFINLLVQGFFTVFGSTAMDDHRDIPAALTGQQQLLADFKWPMIGAGITLLLILIWSVWPASSVDDLEIVDAIEPAVPAQLILDADSAAALSDTTLIAAKQIVVKGVVRLPNDRVLVANEIAFEPDSRIDIPSGRLAVIATRITAARIDVSGHDGLDAIKAGAAGANGETGGIVLVAAATFADSQVHANGGHGGDGARGYSGAAGRNGYCGPRGFGLAQRGATGGGGGMAGNGGAGGVIALLYQTAPAKGDAAKGSAGTPGRGGSGGRGGAGCKGLRGNQPDQPPGNEGTTGRPGSRGAEGSVDTRQVEFDTVIEAFTAWLESDTDAPKALRDRLLALRQIDPS